VLFVGGDEKVPRAVLDDPAAHYGREVTIASGDPVGGLGDLASSAAAEAVVDLSGDPILGGDERFELASVALHRGLEYRAPGFSLRPPPRTALDFGGPVLSVIGTGKRTGKTAVAGHFASLLRERGLDPVIVAMGRGGPPQPQLVRAQERPDLARLLEIARGGAHAASDYLEDAVLAGVTCVGCRRCGEGPAGEVFGSNVLEGARLGASLGPDVLLLEGSGAALPPVHAHRTVCVTSAARVSSQALAYLGPYRLLLADLVVLVGADQPAPAELAQSRERIARWSDPAPIVACSLDPVPTAEPPAAARAAFFTTAPAEREPDLRERLRRHGVEVTVFSSNLARRSALEQDLALAARERCDLYLTELKAAAIDVVAEHAERRGVQLAFVANRPVSLPGEPDLDGELERLLADARADLAPGLEKGREQQLGSVTP
jgi:cyclic 2,3-diphosphoglycerate synthetase